MFHLIFGVLSHLTDLISDSLSESLSAVLLILSVVTVLAVCTKLAKLYYSAKQKHRDEWLDVCWFVNSSYGKTGVALPRALFPIFSVFVGKKMGLTSMGVRIHIKNNHNDVLLCLMEKKRRIGAVIYDLGVGGAVTHGHDIMTTLKEELYEETSIDEELLNKPIELKELAVTTPSENYNCIVYNYLLQIPNELVSQLKSRDGTYEMFSWINSEQLFRMNGTVREDPYTFLVHNQT